MDEETRKKTKVIKEKISDLQIEFSKNCNEESTKLNFSLEQLSKIRLKKKAFNGLKIITFEICSFATQKAVSMKT